MGFAATAVIERWATAIGRWTYSDSMPTIAGIGVSPLLQWLVIPTLLLALARAASRPTEAQSP